METHDVVIVGAGPSGCTAAERLARSGWRVALLEEHEQIGSPVNCSGIIGAEAVERFALPDRLVRHTLTSVEFHSPGGRTWHFEARRPLAHAVERSRFDQLLGYRAAEAGADVLLGRRVVDVERVDGGVEVTTRSMTDESRRMRARVVIMATGAGMPILKKLGWGTIPKRLLGVQTELSLDATEVEVYLGKQWAPEGFAWIIPLGENRAKVGLLCVKNGPSYLKRFLARPDVSGRAVGAPGPIQCSILPLGFLSRSYSDRMLVVGEAAGHIKATTCGGIYYGMLAAEIAADVLDRALAKDRLEAGELREYESRWRELLEDEIRMGMRLRRAFHILSDKTLDRLMSLANRDGLHRLIHDKADFDWHRDLIRAVLRHGTVGRILGAA